MGEVEETQYSDFLFWTRPILAPVPRQADAVPCAMELEEDGDAGCEEQEYNSFNFWHMPPPDPAALGLEAGPGPPDSPTRAAAAYHQRVAVGDSSNNNTTFNSLSSSSSAVPRVSRRGNPGILVLDDDMNVEEEETLEDEEGGGGATHEQAMQEYAEEEEEEEEEEHEGDEAREYDENYDDENDPMALLSGGAGARLLGLLGQLSNHLGASSRFARAATMLQADMVRQREHVLRVEQASPTSPRIEPLEGSTLEQPEVLSTVGSLLSILQDAHGARVSEPPPPPGPLVLFGVDQAMPPPSPASPEALATLSPPNPSSFRLDEQQEGSASCPICLEALGEPSEALQMPCARQHVFHKNCLLTWLDARNTCPVCRHGLPIDNVGDSPSQPAEAEGQLAAANTRGEVEGGWEVVARGIPSERSEQREAPAE
jgi:hypothetical protein